MSGKTAVNYIPYLDGIRAIAVTGVVLFHLGIKPVHGGFVGVDTFFVLSGFLISLIIGRQAAAGTFSFVQFYTRRARRLLPALFAVVLFVLVGSFLLLTPDHFEETSRSGIYAVLSAANINFWLHSGYFDSAKYATPLLHTWSLGVEEQFYIVWPAILIALFKFRNKVILILAMLALTALSFWGMIAFQEELPNGVFYLSPFRAWQFSIGALLAILWEMKGETGVRFIHPIVDSALTLIGGGVLIYAFFITESAGYPGYASVVPTVATLLILMGGKNLISDVALTNPVSIFLGHTSYSIYLWHWPVIVFMRYYNGYSNDLTLSMIVIAGVISVLLGWLSYRFLETPLRHPWTDEPKMERFAVPAGIGVSTLLVVFLSAHIWAGDGWKWRVSSETEAMLTELQDEKRTPCLPRQRGDGRACYIGMGRQDSSFVLVGDSHGRALSQGLNTIAFQNQAKGEIIIRNGTLPFKGIDLYRDKQPLENTPWPDITDALNRSSSDVIIFHSRYGIQWNAYRPEGEAGSVRWIGRDGKFPDDLAESQANFKYGLEETLSELSKLGKKVVLVGAVPHQGVNTRQCITRPTYIMSNAKLVSTCGGFTREESLARTEQVNYVLAEAANRYGYAFINPTKYLCPEGERTCLRGEGDQLFYIDDDHLSKNGAILIAEPVWKAIQALQAGHKFKSDEAPEPSGFAGGLNLNSDGSAPSVERVDLPERNAKESNATRFALSGAELSRSLKASDDVVVRALDQGVVLQSDLASLNGLKARNEGGGAYLEIRSPQEEAFSGRRIKVVITAASNNDVPVRFGALYSTNKVGNSGWLEFEANKTLRRFEFEFDVPADDRLPNFDYLGFAPINGEFFISSIEISIVS